MVFQRWPKPLGCTGSLPYYKHPKCACAQVMSTWRGRDRTVNHGDKWNGMQWPSHLNVTSTSTAGVGGINILPQKFLLITTHSPRKTTKYFRANPDVNKPLSWERLSTNRTNFSGSWTPGGTLPFPFLKNILIDYAITIFLLFSHHFQLVPVRSGQAQSKPCMCPHHCESVILPRICCLVCVCEKTASFLPII